MRHGREPSMDDGFKNRGAVVAVAPPSFWRRIVNITSVIGQVGNFGQVNYAASKAGVAAVTKSLTKEVAAKGITVNAVTPGFIATDMVTQICATGIVCSISSV